MVSIIVPTYNVAAFLEETVDSILLSTYRDIELILVDDGSTDGSGAICDKIASQDNRVKVIHQDNGGISVARNNGLAQSMGEYVMFVDADDVMHASMLQVLVEALQSGDYDLAMVYGKKVAPDDVHDVIDQDMTHNSHMTYQPLEPMDCLNGLYDLTTIQYQVVWNKLYKRTAIEGLAFRQLASEDLDWNNRLFMRIKKAVLVPVELYAYVQHPASIMHQGISTSMIDRIDTLLGCLKEIPQEMSQVRSKCITAACQTFLYVRYFCAKRKAPILDRLEAFGKQMYRQVGNELCHSSHISLARKLSLMCFYRFPWLYAAHMSRLEK